MDRIIIRLKSYLKRSRSGFRLRTYRRIHYANIDATCSWRRHSPRLLKHRVWSLKKRNMINLLIYTSISKFTSTVEEIILIRKRILLILYLQIFKVWLVPTTLALKGLKFDQFKALFGQYTSRLKDDLYYWLFTETSE